PSAGDPSRVPLAGNQVMGLVDQHPVRPPALAPQLLDPRPELREETRPALDWKSEEIHGCVLRRRPEEPDQLLGVGGTLARAHRREARDLLVVALGIDHEELRAAIAQSLQQARRERALATAGGTRDQGARAMAG